MEANKEQEATAFPHTILPPRLEDAGLEDCALPPESIKEAFLKAATAVNSRATSIFTTTSDDEEEETPSCLDDPCPTAKEVSGTSVAVDPQFPDVPGPCGLEKNGGVVEEGGDSVVVVGGGGDDVEEREGCVDGLKGLKIKDKVKNGGGDDDDEEEERDGEKKPILTEVLV